jgi:hypothetical protein
MQNSEWKIARTPEEKRNLAQQLKASDTDTLAFLLASAECFGVADAVAYRQTHIGAYRRITVPELDRIARHGRNRLPHWVQFSIV